MSTILEALKLLKEETLNEGTDYRGQAIKMIVNSGLFNEEVATKIIDGLYRQDIHAFVHAPAWLEKYLKGIARMLIEESNGDTNKAQSFLRECPQVFEKYLTWVKENREKIGSNKLDDEFINKMSYEDIKRKIKEIQSELDKQSKDELSKMKFNNSSSYSLIPITSYEQLHSTYGGNATGDGTDKPGQYAGHSGTSWCHTNSNVTYNDWLSDEDSQFFILQNNNWKNIPFNKQTNTEMQGKDEYGNSLLALLVDSDGLQRVTLRCNHVGVNGMADNQYKTFAELSKIAGFNVEEEVYKHFTPQQHQENVENEYQYLDEASTPINLDNNIPVNLFKLVGSTVPLGPRLGAFCTLSRISDNISYYNIDARDYMEYVNSDLLPNRDEYEDEDEYEEAVSYYVDEVDAEWDEDINEEVSGVLNRITTFTVPEGVVTINSFTFNDCHRLNTVNLPESLNYIKKSAFESCDINELSIPKNVSFIGEDAFAYNHHLTSIKLECSKIVLQKNAFHYCNNLEKVDFTDCKVDGFWEAFTHMTSLKTININARTADGFRNFSNNSNTINLYNFPDLKEINIKLNSGKVLQFATDFENGTVYLPTENTMEDLRELRSFIHHLSSENTVYFDKYCFSRGDLLDAESGEVLKKKWEW